MQVEELADLLRRDYADKLPQWYCDSCRARDMDGFPIALPHVECESKTYLYPEYVMAADAISLAVGGTEEKTRAWMMLERGKTESEWREWWETKGKALNAAYQDAH